MVHRRLTTSTSWHTGDSLDKAATQHQHTRQTDSGEEDYLKVIGINSLPKNKFILVDLNNIPNKDLSRKIENIKLTEEPFNRGLLQRKNTKDLTSDELKSAFEYYSDIDLTNIPLKSRKLYKEKLDNLTNELGARNNNA